MCRRSLGSCGDVSSLGPRGRGLKKARWEAREAMSFSFSWRASKGLTV